MHKWNIKWGNERSDGDRVETIERFCLHCGAQQMIIYSKGSRWAKVVNLDKDGKNAGDFVIKCNRETSDDDNEDIAIVDQPKKTDPVKRKKQLPVSNVVPIDSAADLEKVIDQQFKAPPDPRAVQQIDLNVTVVFVNPEQLQQLIANAVREQFERIFKTV
jgi:hypothetical protein